MPRVVLQTAVTSLLFLSGSGCLSYHQTTRAIHESGAGSVYFEERPATAIRASHPVSIHPNILARVLRGVQVQERSGPPVPSGMGDPPAMPAFSERDIEFLATYLSAALIVVGGDHQISFRIIHPTEFGPAATAGTLYALGSFLYLTLTHLDYTPFWPEILYKTETPLPYSTALTKQIIRFIPKGIGRPINDTPPRDSARPTLTTLVIDYQRLAEPASAVSVPENQQAELERQEAPKDAADRRNADLQAMKLRIHVLKMRLAERGEVIKKLKRATLVKKIKRKKKPTRSRKKKIARTKRQAPPRPAPIVVAKRPPKASKPAPAAPIAPPPPPVKAKPAVKPSPAKPVSQPKTVVAVKPSPAKPVSQPKTVAAVKPSPAKPVGQPKTVAAVKPSPADPVGQPKTVDKAAQPAEGKSEGQLEIQGPPAPPPPELPTKPALVRPSPAEDAVGSGNYVVALFFGMLAFIVVRRFSPAR